MASIIKMDIKMEGFKQLLMANARAGRKIPMKIVGKAARAGAKIALADARQNAPVDTSTLKSGLVIRTQRTRTRAKKVYAVTFDSKKSSWYLKDGKGGRKIFYPAIQEYGFKAQDGTVYSGYHFLRNSIDRNKAEIERVMIDTLVDELEKEWLKG